MTGQRIFMTDHPLRFKKKTTIKNYLLKFQSPEICGPEREPWD